MDCVQQYLPRRSSTRRASTPTLDGMSSEHRAPAGPEASSRETLAEAACELFLEQGFEATSIADITTSRGRQPLELLQLLRVEVRHPVGGPRRADRCSSRQRLDGQEGTDAAAGVRAARSSPIARTSRPTASRSHSSTPTAMGLDDELEREASLRRSRIARAVADRLRARRRRSPATPRSPARPGAARCSPPSTRGRTTAPGARRSARFVSRAADAAAPADCCPRGRGGAAAAGRRAGARLRRGARVLPRRRRDAAGRGVRGRGRRARGDPRRRTGDARAREPGPGRVHRRRRDRRRLERPHPDRPRGRRHRLRSSIASPTRVPRSRHPLETRRGARSTRACGPRPTCS